MPVAQLYVGRPASKPYTTIGIQRVPCARCGEPSHASWQSCANGGRHMALCKECDVGLNAVALEFMRHPHVAELMKAYTEKMEA